MPRIYKFGGSNQLWVSFTKSKGGVHYDFVIYKKQNLMWEIADLPLNS